MIPDTLSGLDPVLAFRDCLGPRVASYEIWQIPSDQDDVNETT